MNTGLSTDGSQLKVITTDNPASYPGREQLSDALRNRSIEKHITEITKAEDFLEVFAHKQYADQMQQLIRFHFHLLGENDLDLSLRNIHNAEDMLLTHKMEQIVSQIYGHYTDNSLEKWQKFKQEEAQRQAEEAKKKAEEEAQRQAKEAKKKAEEAQREEAPRQAKVAWIQAEEARIQAEEFQTQAEVAWIQAKRSLDTSRRSSDTSRRKRKRNSDTVSASTKKYSR